MIQPSFCIAMALEIHIYHETLKLADSYSLCDGSLVVTGGRDQRTGQNGYVQAEYMPQMCARP